MQPFLALINRLARDQRGATIVEFAMVAPVMILALIGLFDLSYNIYATSMLEGAMQKAARDSALEGADYSQAAIDTRVSETVRAVVPSANFSFDRRAYSNFRDVGAPEDFTDSNGDGVCNDGEPFEDVNGNHLWDSDRGRSGTGGARDAVLYSVTISYERQFPLHEFIGIPGEVTTTARTVLRNQPFGMQATEVTVQNC